MKKNILMVALLFSFISIQAQNKSASVINPTEKKNDIKLNVTFPLFGIFEIAYERNLIDGYRKECDILLNGFVEIN